MGIKKKIKKELIGTSDYPSNKIFTISNFITFTRLVLTLVFLYLFVTDNNRVVAIVIYAIAASTDWMDGQIARMTKTVSWLGKVMDPICDRALLLPAFGTGGPRRAPIWVCVLIIGRDIYLASARLSCVIITVAPSSRLPGKIATALLMTGFSLMLLGSRC
ncbi:MAG: CDP-alcohol phosphatidyltransferase family protein [Collinsella sp.]